jgi:hypothetical protein
MPMTGVEAHRMTPYLLLPASCRLLSTRALGWRLAGKRVGTAEKIPAGGCNGARR